MARGIAPLLHCLRGKARHSDTVLRSMLVPKHHRMYCRGYRAATTGPPRLHGPRVVRPTKSHQVRFKARKRDAGFHGAQAEATGLWVTSPPDGGVGCEVPMTSVKAQLCRWHACCWCTGLQVSMLAGVRL